MRPDMLIIHPHDNVGVALRDISRGEHLKSSDGRTLTAVTDIPWSHKLSLVPLAAGTSVLKYGEVIGTAAEALAAGAWVHTHNLHTEEEP